MSATFEIHTTETTDQHGRPAYVNVITMDGKPIVRMTTTSTSPTSRDHVVSGVNVKGKSDYLYARDDSTPSTMAETFTSEPSVEDVAGTALDKIALEEAYTLVKYGKKGTPIPEGKRPAFYSAVEAAKQRFGRRTRNGVLIGEARSPW